MAIDPSILTKPLPKLTPEYIRELFGDPVEDARRTRAFKATGRWFDEHFEEIRAEYPDRFVAIYGCRVVADAAGLRELSAIIRADSTVEHGSVLVQFMKPAMDPSILTKPFPELTPEYLRKLFGDPVEDARRSREHDATENFYADHSEEIRAEYPNRFVAIHGCRVLADAATLRELNTLIWADRAVEPGTVLIRFMKSAGANGNGGVVS